MRLPPSWSQPPICHPSAPLPLAAVTKLEWESPLRILQYPDPRLRAPNARVGVFDETLKALTDEMFELMYQ